MGDINARMRFAGHRDEGTKLSKVTIITIIIMAVPRPWPSSSAAKLRIKSQERCQNQEPEMAPLNTQYALCLKIVHKRWGVTFQKASLLFDLKPHYDR
jgi:hypothetical protein